MCQGETFFPSLAFSLKQMAEHEFQALKQIHLFTKEITPPFILFSRSSFINPVRTFLPRFFPRGCSTPDLQLLKSFFSFWNLSFKPLIKFGVLSTADLNKMKLLHLRIFWSLKIWVRNALIKMSYTCYTRVGWRLSIHVRYRKWGGRPLCFNCAPKKLVRQVDSHCRFRSMLWRLNYAMVM